jgi:arylsulfatase
VPAIARWPGQIPAGQSSDEITTTMDLLPTFAELAGAPLPKDRRIDGVNLFPLVTGAGEESAERAHYFYCHTHLHGVRMGKWKLVLPRPAKPAWMGWWARMIDEVPEKQLFDLSKDLGEFTNLAQQYPEVVAELMKHVERARRDLGDCNRVGTGARFFDEGTARPGIRQYQKWLMEQEETAPPP